MFLLRSDTGHFFSELVGQDGSVFPQAHSGPRSAVGGSLENPQGWAVAQVDQQVGKGVLHQQFLIVPACASFPSNPLLCSVA